MAKKPPPSNTDEGPEVEPEHVPTRQENDLHKALMAGDADRVAELHDDAYEAVQELDAETGLTQAGQYDLDYVAAFRRYQNDHEMPEEDRMSNTVEQVERENADAPNAEAPKTPATPVEPAPDESPDKTPEAPGEPAQKPTEQPDEDDEQNDDD